ncbi:N-methyltransferase [Penicillium verhagenii]|uniref:N-methyltransferase n=1 Tax=Penicillium verhagenii TaxID=1562060 RepID=UPI002545393E|nr:N-methyltransferase [Penicillium verhagenii]KAJ5930331.1 N-methyltransferase [Penicillium verhagenii]
MAPSASFLVQSQPSWLEAETHRPRLDSFPPATQIHLHDIRRHTDDEGLVTQIATGLKSEEKSLPSLLLWNKRGLELFDAILDSGKYYPAVKEPELLSTCMPKIAHSIPSGGRVIELGAGNMRKTAFLLRNLEMQHKHVEYFALDVSHSSLRSSIRELLELFPWNPMTKIQGLLGTYEDCISWLHSQGDQKSPVTLLWLGNSIANFTSSEASDLIARFFTAGQASSVPVQMIAGIDGCQSEDEIVESYESEKSSDFVLNGLEYANSLLGTETFLAEDWGFCGEWNMKKSMHESFYVAQRKIYLEIEEEQFQFRPGERVRAIQSGKWPQDKVSDICAAAKTSIVNTWSNQDGSYGVYLIKNAFN